MAYRKTRNLEASIIDFITDKLEEDNWTSIRVEKSFSNVYEGTLPCILVEEYSDSAKRLEIGGDTYIELQIINIRIFAKNDGQRLDLKDWLFDVIKNGLDYYEHLNVSGEVGSTTLAGRINVNRIVANKKEMANTEMLHLYDRFRHILTLEVKVALT